MDPYRIRATAERLKRLPEGRRRRLRVVRGNLFYGIHEFPPQGATYITMLHEPLARTLSAYYFILPRKKEDAGSRRLEESTCYSEAGDIERLLRIKHVRRKVLIEQDRICNMISQYRGVGLIRRRHVWLCVIWGYSAGGHLAALLGTSGGVPELEGTGDNMQYSSQVQAVCMRVVRQIC